MNRLKTLEAQQKDDNTHQRMEKNTHFNLKNILILFLIYLKMI